MPVIQMNCRSPFNDYWQAMMRNPPPDWNRGLALEAMRRLGQLDWLLIEIQRREVEVAAAMANADRGIPSEFMLGQDQIRALADAFYYISWRTREVIRRLPGLAAFDPKGIRYVRNHLIEHPEKHPDVALAGWQFGGDFGVRLLVEVNGEPAIAPGDPGLYANSIEFRDELLPRLSRAAMPPP
jgi:hypothetical protein